MAVKIQQERYTSAAAFLAACDARTPNSYAEYNRSDRESAWQGDTYSAARDYLLHGDAAAVAGLKPHKLTQAESIAPRRVRDVAGYAPIVPAALEGLPRCMKRRKACATRSKVLTLVCDIDGNCDKTPEEFFEAGRKLCAFIRGAELAGYSVALDAFMCFARPSCSHGYALRLNIKAAGQPLDIKRVAYALTHASFERQLSFDWYERFPNGRAISGYGQALYSTPQHFRDEVLAQVLDKNERYISLFDTDYSQLLK